MDDIWKEAMSFGESEVRLVPWPESYSDIRRAARILGLRSESIISLHRSFKVEIEAELIKMRLKDG